MVKSDKAASAAGADKGSKVHEKLAAWVDAEGLDLKRPSDNEGDVKNVVGPNKNAKFRKLKDRRICIVSASYL